MTLVGINWFAVALAVAVNMVYAHYYYLPKVTAELNKSSEKYGKSNQKKIDHIYTFLFPIWLWPLPSGISGQCHSFRVKTQF